MSKIMQNLVVFPWPSGITWDTSLRAGNMILNRFCIDEDAAFELSGVNYLMQSSFKIVYEHLFKPEGQRKGKEYSFLYSYFILRNFISMNN